MRMIRLVVMLTALTASAAARADVAPPDADVHVVDMSKVETPDLAKVETPDLAKAEKTDMATAHKSSNDGGCSMTGHPSGVPFGLLGLGLLVAFAVGRRKTA